MQLEKLQQQPCNGAIQLITVTMYGRGSLGPGNSLSAIE
jgi:hypothetical protein